MEGVVLFLFFQFSWQLEVQVISQSLPSSCVASFTFLHWFILDFVSRIYSAGSSSLALVFEPTGSNFNNIDDSFGSLPWRVPYLLLYWKKKKKPWGAVISTHCLRVEVELIQGIKVTQLPTPICHRIQSHLSVSPWLEIAMEKEMAMREKRITSTVSAVFSNYHPLQDPIVKWLCITCYSYNIEMIVVAHIYWVFTICQAKQ